MRSTVANIVLFVAAVFDLFLFAFLISISGYLFGTGSRSLHWGPVLTGVYAAVVLACLAAPVAGLVFHRCGKTAIGMLIAWLPAAGVAVMLMIPAPY